MEKLKNRKNTRLKGADYNRNQAVFLTICTKERQCLLSKIVGTGVPDGPQIELTKYGRIADKYIIQLNDFYEDLSVESYVIMPNHIHAIIVLNGSTTGLFVVIGQYKSAVTRKIRKIKSNMEVWQTSFHDHVIRSEEDYQRIWAYIDTNPMRWRDDCFYVEVSA